MINWISLLLVVFALVLLEGFFSGSEIAIISASRVLLLKREGVESRIGKILDQFRKSPQYLLGTHVIGTNACVVIATTLVTFYLKDRFGGRGELYTLLIMSPLLLVLGEMVPKITFQRYADQLASRSLLGLWIFSYLFYPLVWLLAGLAELASRLLGGKRGEAEPFFSKAELEYLLVYKRRRDDLPVSAQRMIGRVFHFSKTRVREVMVPLVEVKALEDEQSIRSALEFAVRWTYSRYPVYQERVDNIIGMVRITDLLSSDSQEQKLSNLIMPIRFVPETMPVDELLEKMQRDNFQMAVVVDEYGGCIGIITREDILEEVVGEIEDEHDESKRPLYRQIGFNRWLIQGRMEIDQINELFKWSLPKNDYETLAGFLLEKFQRIPKIGEIFRYENFTFLIKKANPRSILEVMVYLEEETKAEKPKKPEP